jgi:riboflavin synthase
MFTGIVEAIGRVSQVDRRQGALGLEVTASILEAPVEIGESVAVNGVCLTVVAHRPGAIAVEAVPETLRRTNLGRLEVGSDVNVERALTAGKPMGGHYVQGHVDGTATIASITPDGEARTYRLAHDAALSRYVVAQGFIAVDGASLTVVNAEPGAFTVTLVPHTQGAIVMGRADAGSVVNLEVDAFGKYAERAVQVRLAELERRLAILEQAR